MDNMHTRLKKEKAKSNQNEQKFFTIHSNPSPQQRKKRKCVVEQAYYGGRSSAAGTRYTGEAKKSLSFQAFEVIKYLPTGQSKYSEWFIRHAQG